MPSRERFRRPSTTAARSAKWIAGDKERSRLWPLQLWQASDVGNFGGAANYSVYDNKDRTKNVAGGVDFTTGSFTHSFRAEYLKFVNVIADATAGSGLPLSDQGVEINLPGTGFRDGAEFPRAPIYNPER